MSNEATITEAEVHAFAAKLDEWGSTLSEKEQVMLHTLLSNATTGESEVEGFALHKAGGDELRVGSGGAGKANLDLVVDSLSPQLMGPTGWGFSPTSSGGRLMADRPATNAE